MSKWFALSSFVRKTVEGRKESKLEAAFDDSRNPEPTCHEPTPVENEAIALSMLPDDVFLHIIAACGDGESTAKFLPEHEAVKGLGCLCRGTLLTLYRLRPVVYVQVHSYGACLTVAHRLANGPWRIMLRYDGVLTEQVVENARQGRVQSISMRHCPLDSAVAGRVVPELLGAGCFLLDFKLEDVRLDDTWCSVFGEAEVCSEMLLDLQLDCCCLRGPIPEMRLPSLRGLFLFQNRLTGGLGPLMGCPALREVDLSDNKLTGDLKPLQRCTALQTLDMYGNNLTGGLEPLAGCKALQEVDLTRNQLTGSLKPLGSCKALVELNLSDNQLTGDLEPLANLTMLRRLDLSRNRLVGGLQPLQGTKGLHELYFTQNELKGSLEPLQGCIVLKKLDLSHNLLNGGLEPLQGCAMLSQLWLTHNEFSGGLEPLKDCTALQGLFLCHNALTGGLEPLQGLLMLEALGLYQNKLSGSLKPLQCCPLLQKVYLCQNQELIGIPRF